MLELLKKRSDKPPEEDFLCNKAILEPLADIRPQDEWKADGCWVPSLSSFTFGGKI